MYTDPVNVTARTPITDYEAQGQWVLDQFHVSNFMHQERLNAEGWSISQTGFMHMNGIPINMFALCKQLHKDGKLNFESPKKMRERQSPLAAILVPWLERHYNEIGEHDPTTSEIRIPFTRKKWIWHEFEKDMALRGLPTVPGKHYHCSESYFYQVWKEYFPHVVVTPYSKFKTCEICSDFHEAIEKSRNLNERAKLKDQRAMHIQQVRLLTIMYGYTSRYRYWYGSGYGLSCVALLRCVAWVWTDVGMGMR
jgi:hypothetical protein